MKNVRLEDVRQMIAETDKDGSGAVDFEEFLQARTYAQTGLGAPTNV
jgi:Ca2+-binding EF-hand superfamily protein